MSIWELMFAKRASARVIAAMDSTTTTALWDDDRVVAAVDFQGEWFFVFGDGLLWLADGMGLA